MKTNILDRTTPPKSNEMQFDGFPQFEKTLINNNIPCYFFNNKNSDAIRLDIAIPIGKWDEEKPLQSSMTAKIMTEGTKKFDAFQIAETFDFNGAYIEINSTMHYIFVRVLSLKQKLNQLFPIIKSIIFEATFPKNELKIIAENNKQDFIIENKKVFSIARNIFPSMLYGEKHPYGKIMEEKFFNEISSDDLHNFYSKLPIDKSSVYIGGNIDTDVFNFLEDIFKDTKKIEITEKNYATSPFAENKKIIEVKNAMQSAVIIGLPTIGRKHKDFPLLMLTNMILGGFFGSKLMKVIREEKGYTYGIYSIISARAKYSHLSIQSEIIAENTNQAVDEIFSVINRLSTTLISNNELNIARNYLFGKMLRNIDGPFALVEQLENINAEGIDVYDYFDYYWKSISQAKPDDIKEIASKYLDTNKIKTLIVGQNI
ncbi:MAG: insulinase family protein [Bacteroidales bacterium]|jgi:predicted Zn-dependent peptidase|nr:insulinase family protein [Bacteroidales bacterium]